MADDAPRRTGSWLHSIAVVVLVLVGFIAVTTAVDLRFRGDGAVSLLTAAVSLGFLALVTRSRS